jgi:hypothetical protein
VSEIERSKSICFYHYGKTEDTNSEIRKEREIKGLPIEKKERKVSSYVDVIVYIEM